MWLVTVNASLMLLVSRQWLLMWTGGNKKTFPEMSFSFGVPAQRYLCAKVCCLGIWHLALFKTYICVAETCLTFELFRKWKYRWLLLVYWFWWFFFLSHFCNWPPEILLPRPVSVSSVVELVLILLRTYKPRLDVTTPIPYSSHLHFLLLPFHFTEAELTHSHL